MSAHCPFCRRRIPILFEPPSSASFRPFNVHMAGHIAAGRLKSTTA